MGTICANQVKGKCKTRDGETIVHYNGVSLCLPCVANEMKLKSPREEARKVLTKDQAEQVTGVCEGEICLSCQ